LVNRANAWRGKKDFTRAKADYDSALALKPGLPAAQQGTQDMARLLAKKATGEAVSSDKAPKLDHDHE
jgi:hypothetical protein